MPVTDLQFPIDVSGVQKDHPFLDSDSLQSLFRRLHALNRCAKMKVDNMPKNTVSTIKFTIFIELECSILTHSMAQQPLKSFDRALMRISLSDSILVTLVFC